MGNIYCPILFSLVNKGIREVSFGVKFSTKGKIKEKYGTFRFIGKVLK